MTELRFYAQNDSEIGQLEAFFSAFSLTKETKCNTTKEDTHTHTRLVALCPGLPGWAGTRKVKPIWILLKQVTVSGSGISWAVCKSAPRSRHIAMPAPHHSVFYRLGCPSCRPTNSVKALKEPKTYNNHLTAVCPGQPGRPVPEETFTRSHSSWSTYFLYHLSPFATVHGILFIQRPKT